MGRLFTVSLEGNIYTCKHCGTHLALHEDVVSKCAHGEAYLFKKIVNVTRGKLLVRMKMTGQHTVAVVFCVGCGVMIGWTYECAHEYREMCREGKSVLERLKLWFQGPDGRSPPNHEAPVEIDPFDDLAMNTVMI